MCVPSCHRAFAPVSLLPGTLPTCLLFKFSFSFSHSCSCLRSVMLAPSLMSFSLPALVIARILHLCTSLIKACAPLDCMHHEGEGWCLCSAQPRADTHGCAHERMGGEWVWGDSLIHFGWKVFIFFSTTLFPEQELYKAERIQKVSFLAFFQKEILLPIQIPTVWGVGIQGFACSNFRLGFAFSVISQSLHYNRNNLLCSPWLFSV